MRFVVILFIIIPLTEMMLLFEVADRIGGLATLSLVVLTAVIGVQILKRQGLSTLTRANHRLQSGQLPAQEIVEGMMLAGAGALLLTPGFITDTLGFIFLTGSFRRPIARRIIHSGMVRTFRPGGGSGGFEFWSAGHSSYKADSAKVYEGEYTEDGLSQLDQGQEKNGPDDKLH